MMSVSFETGSAPHIPPRNTVSKTMLQVVYALCPGLIAYVWFFGPGVLVQVSLAIIFALLFETLMLKLRAVPAKMFLTDGSAAVTAILFALCIPPLAPWWVALVGMFFAIVMAKHLYGGLGQNIFNPAMIGYVVVLISFPQALTQWTAPSAIAVQALNFSETLTMIFFQQLPAQLTWDAISQATPLDSIRTSLATGDTLAEVRKSALFGDFGGLGWEWVANWYAIGGLWLIWKRVISWHVPVSMIGTVLILSLAAYLADPGGNPSPLQHVFSGALVLGAFFIATDPVSGCTSNKGRLIFAAGVGLFTLLIRRWGGYPDGVAFAVLLMNMAAPVIDRYTRPRIYGQ
jgi:electron transport complex protein RnfD